MAVTSRWSVLRTLAAAVRTATRPGSASLSERASAVPRMVRASLSGDYTGLSRGKLLMILGAGAYIVSPVDLIPEGVFSVFGLADDAMVASWLAAALVNETESFLDWEKDQAGGATWRQSGQRTDASHTTVRSDVVS